jgi:carbon-monoxide dehydrogenase medium subunit
MKPARFDYLRARSVEEAVRALADAHGEGKIIAGGQSLAPVLALRMARPALLVDVNRIPGLGGIARTSESSIRIGALVRHSALMRQRDHPLLAEVAGWIGHTAIRSRGTTGGSIAHADPSAELPVIAAALEAVVQVTGPQGAREVAAEDLFVGALETSLTEHEMITSVEFPIPRRWGFAELSRRHGDFGLVTVVAAETEGRWRIAVGGVGTVPYRPAEAEALLADGPLTEVTIVRAAAATAAGIDPSPDIHASGDYRRAMTEEFTRRALARATAGPDNGAADER